MPRDGYAAATTAVTSLTMRRSLTLDCIFSFDNAKQMLTNREKDGSKNEPALQQFFLFFVGSHHLVGWLDQD